MFWVISSVHINSIIELAISPWTWQFLIRIVPLQNLDGLLLVTVVLIISSV
jgi:hypothetical protein